MRGTRAGIRWVVGLFLSAFILSIHAEPVKIIRKDQIEGAKVRLPNGDIQKVYLTKEGNMGGAILSSDEGVTWSKPEKTPRAWASKVFLDRDGQMHAFFFLMRVAQPGRRIGIDKFLDVWHVKTSGPDKAWGQGRIVQEGWNGSIVDNAVQLESGRIVQPSQDWVPGSKSGPPTGNGYALTLYSDDKGETWSQSNRITAPVYEGYNGANFGACEPSIVILNDGRLWMLMRAQTGYLHEAYSRDGAEWSAGASSSFHSSTGPPSLLRLADNRLLLFWNNCEMPPRVDGKGVYAGRDALHGAVSLDDGKTWRGFREVALDPNRSQSPPKTGDRGVAYPYAVPSADGQYAEVATGHGSARVVLRVDPNWLLEKERSEDFSEGLENWSVFKPFGPVGSWWRDRAPGALIVDDPSATGKKVLHLRKPDENDADGATWNFPAGHRGELSCRVMFRQGQEGGVIALQDRFFEPTDKSAPGKAIYAAIVQADGQLLGSEYRFPLDQWVSLQMIWDDEAKACRLLVGGAEVAILPMLNPSKHGVSYLWLCSTARNVDMAGMMIGSIKARVE